HCVWLLFVSLTHSLSHSPLLSLYPSKRQVTCDPPGEAAFWVKHSEFGFSLRPSPTLPLYHSPTLPLSPSMLLTDRKPRPARGGTPSLRRVAPPSAPPVSAS